MAKPQDMDKPKIQMLLDIENIFGESTKGLGQLVLALCVGLIPVLVTAYFGLYIYIPWKILVAICVIWFIRSMMVIKGRERERVRHYKKIQEDVYSAADDMINIRSARQQGCVEYVNGTVGFFVVTYNNSEDEGVWKSKQIDRFIGLAVGKHDFDIRIQNINSTEEIDNRYNNVTLFSDEEAAGAFMEIIDYNREMVSKRSTLTRNIIFVRGSKYQWKEIVSDIQSALSSESARVFRKAYMVTDRDEINEIISRDINGYVDLEEMLQKKYRTGNKRGAKIISYDFEDLVTEEESQEVIAEEITAFIPKM